MNKGSRAGLASLVFLAAIVSPASSFFWQRNTRQDLDTRMENALGEAIRKGAPMYNKGDIKGCADLYMETAESVLPAASGAEKQRLKDGLQTARSSSSSKEAAWALRRAFDDILEGLGGGHEVPRGNENAVVHQRIRDAISIGVPLYNAGDHGACADVYTVCVREIEGSLDQSSSEAARSLLRQLPSFSNDNKRAWALRDLMDAILAGSLASANKTMMLDFRQASQIQQWKSVNDGVMGGMSTGSMSFGSELGEACGVFSGVLSTQNNGGFASVRGPSAAYDLSGYRGLAISFRGDARQYKLTVKTDTQWDSPMYQADFLAEEGPAGWVTKELAWSKFKPSWRGRVIDSAPPLSGKGIAGLGLMISFLTDSGLKSAAFRTGAFRLAVKSIKPF